MMYLLFWWLLLIAAGWAAFPIAFHFLPGLADRGYAFAKPLALLLVAYPFWLLTSLGLVQNTFGAVASLLFILTAAAWVWKKASPQSQSPLAWMRTNWRTVLAIELVFSIAYFAFAYYRAFNPEIQATEKPMEFMFLNSILQSIQFPPHDAWLSGYAISYYYLGYVIVAALARLTDVPSSYAFNLGLIMVYALCAAGVFGLVFDLVHRLESRGEAASNHSAPIVFGVVAAFLLLVSGNFEGPLESLHNAGVGSEDLYKFLDINGLTEAPISGTLVPADNWWWWRASRVVNDHDPVTGAHIEVIDEFPSFSFLLGDLHPHVLALPFGLLALAVAFNLYLEPPAVGAGLLDSARHWLTPGMLLTAIILGSLAMLNTWDIVTYGFVIVAAFGLAAFRDSGNFSRALLVRTGIFGIALLLVSVLLYLPFYFGFSSQAGGVLPTIIFKTPLQQYLIMFGLFDFVLASLVGVLLWQRRARRPELLASATTWFLTLFAVPVAIGLVGTVLLLASHDLRQRVADLLHVGNADQTLPTVLEALRQYLVAFAYSLPLFILLVLLMSFIIALVRDSGEANGRAERELASLDSSTIFVLLIALTGLALTFGVEFLYIRDTFGTRMNTVFKLYFQAWTLFSVAGGFGAYYVARSLRAVGRGAWLAAFGILFALSLVYPALAYPNRANAFQASPKAGIPTLNGTRWIESVYPDDFAAIQWLNSNAPRGSIILEAPGGEYTFYDRVSMATGLPTVVGWAGHELQWRGSGDEAGKREREVEQVYKSTDIVQVGNLLTSYGVDYVIVGSLEREKYGLVPPMVDKFGKLGSLAFSQGGIRIYAINRQ